MSGYVRGASRVRMWMAIAVMMFAAVGHAGKAEATSYFNAAELLEECESATAADVYGCTRYIAGMADMTTVYVAWGEINEKFRIPERVTLGQLRKVVIKGLNEVPEELHLQASSLVFNIFAKAFPCD